MHAHSCVYMRIVGAVKCLNHKRRDQSIAVDFGSIGTMAIMKLIAHIAYWARIHISEWIGEVRWGLLVISKNVLASAYLVIHRLCCDKFLIMGRVLYDATLFNSICQLITEEVCILINRLYL